jgi:hypothetical protein
MALQSLLASATLVGGQAQEHARSSSVMRGDDAVAPVRGRTPRDQRGSARTRGESSGVVLPRVRGLAIQLSQGQGRQPLAPEGAPRTAGVPRSTAAFVLE